MVQDKEVIIVKPDLTIMYNGYVYSVDQMSMICFQKNMFDVVKMGNGLAIKSRIHDFVVFYTADGDVKIGVRILFTHLITKGFNSTLMKVSIIFNNFSQT